MVAMEKKKKTLEKILAQISQYASSPHLKGKKMLNPERHGPYYNQ